jgi:hypothetical protein
VGKATVRGGNTVAIHNVIFKKTTKLNSQPARYKKKSIKTSLKKKIIKRKEKKLCREIL